MQSMKGSMPQVDPACFPLLHPKGQPGFRYFMKKATTKSPTSDEQIDMQVVLDESRDVALDNHDFAELEESLNMVPGEDIDLDNLLNDQEEMDNVAAQDPEVCF